MLSRSLTKRPSRPSLLSPRPVPRTARLGLPAPHAQAFLPYPSPAVGKGLAPSQSAATLGQAGSVSQVRGWVTRRGGGGGVVTRQQRTGMHLALMQASPGPMPIPRAGVSGACCSGPPASPSSCHTAATFLHAAARLADRQVGLDVGRCWQQAGRRVGRQAAAVPIVPQGWQGMRGIHDGWAASAQLPPPPPATLGQAPTPPPYHHHYTPNPRIGCRTAVPPLPPP